MDKDEHLAFLKELDFHGKGNWAKIAKDFVPSRTSTQVASHAQKYFMRLLDANSNERKYRKKSSVFNLSLEKIEDNHHAFENNQQSVQETHNVSSYVPIENNQQSVEETHNVPSFVQIITE
ncbi:probable transcription factor At5g61620 [Solanum dulcamara]|uniref:probable transcription factor At5g61620 n=1 Tax=Solanum dulcamara TaxID=45834 RepID=UPI002484FB02|nr:probable transcription factor At5g61620 [Solanum dulcamara]